ncbi:hypothetical protein [Legionella taurinensis]|uniref:Uncharacterized protein n=1 Tax=Legionella taurinensis TaxID=70611 RepID=A0A3A5L2Z3_9GAMM|nr:hypothetical protein [Legionella taurinensis]RJT45913.1 hypothetical protein D6J04_09960 [Legionella taurinensis]RJT66411.1 hypothetical protein D6J03_10600 [Legionella taurinensis]STY27385.1 Uncharacterised protein [Legionella taurinensis]
MSNKKKCTGITIETLVLVAVWETPFIFQGCFKITELEGSDSVLFFFRCQGNHAQQPDILHTDFSSEHYEFSHFYHEEGLIHLGHLDKTQEDALYLLKYALHVTLGEMISSRKRHFTSIDDIAMQALIDKVRVILKKEFTLPAEDHIGFAVAMDFRPEVDRALLAALTLLGKLKKTGSKARHTH